MGALEDFVSASYDNSTFDNMKPVTDVQPLTPSSFSSGCGDSQKTSITTSRTTAGADAGSGTGDNSGLSINGKHISLSVIGFIILALLLVFATYEGRK